MSFIGTAGMLRSCLKLTPFFQMASHYQRRYRGITAFVKGAFWSGMHFHCFLISITGMSLILSGKGLSDVSLNNAILLYLLFVIPYLIYDFFEIIKNNNNNNGLDEIKHKNSQDLGYFMFTLLLIVNMLFYFFSF